MSVIDCDVDSLAPVFLPKTELGNPNRDAPAAGFDGAAFAPGLGVDVPW